MLQMKYCFKNIVQVVGRYVLTEKIASKKSMIEFGYWKKNRNVAEDFFFYKIDNYLKKNSSLVQELTKLHEFFNSHRFTWLLRVIFKWHDFSRFSDRVKILESTDESKDNLNRTLEGWPNWLYRREWGWLFQAGQIVRYFSLNST